MKTIREKRIEDDRNKKWAQIRYNRNVLLSTNYIKFSNQINNAYGWEADPTNFPTFYSYFNRGDTLQQYYFDKASEEPKEQLGNLDYFYFFYACKMLALNYINNVYNFVDDNTRLLVAHLMADCMLGALIDTSNLYISEPYRLYKMISKYNTDPLIHSALKINYINKVKKLKDVNEHIMLSDTNGYCNAILNKDNLSQYEYQIGGLRLIWNDFVDKSSEYLNTINTEGYYDADGNWHWKYSACWVKITVNIEDKVTAINSQLKLFTHNKLVRGRYQSNTYLNRSFDSSTTRVTLERQLIEE